MHQERTGGNVDEYTTQRLASLSLSGKGQGVWSEGDYAPRFAYYAQARTRHGRPGLYPPLSLTEASVVETHTT